MRRNWRTLCWAWGPVVVLMALLFFASAQPKNPPPPSAESIYFSGAMPIFDGMWDALVKKSAHVIAYGALAVLLLRALRLTTSMPLREAANTAILLAICYALTDELHQAFVTGRNSSVLDIGFDYVGATGAVLITRWVLERRTRPTDPKRKLSPHVKRAPQPDC